MLFKIEKDKPIIESNPEISNFAKLSVCTDRELRWIFFVYDYDTPLRKLPSDIKKEKGADLAGFLREKGSARLDKNARNTVTGKIQHVNDAVDEFMELQYDQEKDLILAYDTQLADARDLMKKKDKSDKDWGILVKLNKELPGMMKTKKDLEMVVGYRMEEEASSSDEISEEPLSTLDMIHLEEDM